MLFSRIIVLILLFTNHCYVILGTDLENTPDQEIYSNILNLVEKSQISDSIPYIDVLVDRLEQRSSTQKSELPSLYFFGGIGYLQSSDNGNDGENLDKALIYFEKYNLNFPDGEQAHNCLLKRGLILKDQNKWIASNQVFIKLYQNHYLKDRLSQEERQEVLQQIVENFYILKNWEKGYPWFTLLLKTSKDPEIQSRTSLALVEADLEKDELDSIKKWLPFLTKKTPARYQVGFNIALLGIARELSKKNQAPYAALFYRLVIDSQEIIDYHQKRKSLLKKQLSTLSKNLSINKEDLSNYRMECNKKIQQAEQQIAILQNPENPSYVPPYTMTLKWLQAKNYLTVNRPYEAFWAFYQILNQYPQSPNIEEIIYSAFSLALKNSFNQHAIELGTHYINDKKNQKFRRPIAVQLGKLYIDQKQYQKFLHLAEIIITENSGDNYAAELIARLGAMYLENQNLEGMKNQFYKLWKANPSNTATAGCTYWYALAQFLDNELHQAKERFLEIIEYFPDSDYYPEAQFRYASILYSLEQWEKANLQFEKFVLQYPKTLLVPEAESFMGDIDAYQGKLQPALHHYQRVNETVNLKENPQQIDFVVHATFQTAKLLEQNQRPNEAIQVYLDFIKQHPKAKSLPEIIYSLGIAYEKSDNPGQMLKVWIDAVAKYGDDPSADGIDRILELYAEKFEYYQKTIVINQTTLERLYYDAKERFKIINDGAYRYKRFMNPYIDKELVYQLTHNRTFRSKFVNNPQLLDPLVKKYQNMLKNFVKESPKVTFTAAYQKAFSQNLPTLGFRIQMVLDHIGGSGDHSIMIFSDDELQIASPATLLWMGKKMQDMGHLQIAKTAYQRAITRYPQSPSIPKTLLALASLALQQGDPTEAIHHFISVETDFPNTRAAASAILGRGKVLMQQKKYPQARQVFQSILKNRDWRGEIFFQALYHIGKTHYQESNLQDALSFFERAYFGGVQFRTPAILSLQNILEILTKLGDRERTQILIQEFMDNDAFYDYCKNSKDETFIKVYGTLQEIYQKY